MSLPADYHMHTPLCRHASGEPVEYAARAKLLGFTEIGFTDHSPMPRDDFDNWRMRFDQLGEYVEKVGIARRQHPELTIRLGLEVDFLPGHEDWIRQLSQLYPWDYFIGSVHYISDSWAVDDPTRISEWKNRDPGEVWAAYFERLTEAATSGLFETIGHADLPKKFCFYPAYDRAPLFKKFVQAVKRAGIAIELNTAGLRKDCREIYPSPELLQMAAEEQVPITFASDAHATAEVGMDFARAVELARSVGYTTTCRFAGRQRTMVEL